MEFSGIVIGLYTLALIGFGHAWVKWLLGYFGAWTWIPVALLGAGLVIGSLFFANIILSALFAIAGFTTLWGAFEIIGHRHEFEFKYRLKKTQEAERQSQKEKI